MHGQNRSTSAAHVVLRNSDILTVILKALYPDSSPWENFKDESQERRCALSRLARVCRLFKDPALTFLWRSLDGLEPFLDLAPETFHPICRDQVYSVYLITRSKH